MQPLSTSLLLAAAGVTLALALSSCGQSGPLRPADPQPSASETAAVENTEEGAAAEQGTNAP